MIITGKGQPDVATRLFLNKVHACVCTSTHACIIPTEAHVSTSPPASSSTRRYEHSIAACSIMKLVPIWQVRTELKVPVLGLFDADPYGLKILSVYMKVRAP